MTQPNQDQAVTEFMESHGFEWDDTQACWVNAREDIMVEGYVALFFCTICQKAEREARLDESKRARDCIMYDEGAIDKIDERIWELKNGTI